MDDLKEVSAIKIQSLWRGVRTRLCFVWALRQQYESISATLDCNLVSRTVDADRWVVKSNWGQIGRDDSEGSMTSPRYICYPKWQVVRREDFHNALNGKSTSEVDKNTKNNISPNNFKNKVLHNSSSQEQEQDIHQENDNVITFAEEKQPFVDCNALKDYDRHISCATNTIIEPIEAPSKLHETSSSVFGSATSADRRNQQSSGSHVHDRLAILEEMESQAFVDLRKSQNALKIRIENLSM